MNGVESIKPYYTEDPNAREVLHKKRNLQLKKKITKVKKPKDILDKHQKMFDMFFWDDIPYIEEGWHLFILE